MPESTAIKIREYFKRKENYSVYAVTFLNNKIGTRCLRIHVHFDFMEDDGNYAKRRFTIDVPFDADGDLYKFSKTVVDTFLPENNFTELNGGAQLVSYVEPQLFKREYLHTNLNILIGNNSSFTGFCGIEMFTEDGYPFYSTTSKIDHTFLSLLTDYQRDKIFDTIRTDELEAIKLLQGINKIKENMGEEYRLLYEI